MPAVREQVVLNGNLPGEIQEMLQNVSEYGNPMGESPRKRPRWTKGLEKPPRTFPRKIVQNRWNVLWYVSDYFSYHQRGQDAAKVLTKVFNRLGLDFGILGSLEKCDGDSQRLVGEKGLFEELALYNDEQFQKYEHDTLVVTDPHAFNAFKNHYPK